MIVVADRDQLRLVTQPDHARFAAQLLSLWRRRDVRRHPRRDLLIAAVREHDNGWREADAAPRIDPATGAPYDFRSLPAELHREIWRRGVERGADENPYFAVLIAQHALELHRDRRAVPGWADFLRRLAERQSELLAAAGLDESTLAADYRWLELADAVSLTVCCRSPATLVCGAETARLRDGELEIEPFPFAGATTFEIPCRHIPARRYRGEADLASALARAPWTAFSVRCRAAPETAPVGG